MVPEIHNLSCPYHHLLSHFFPLSYFSLQMWWITVPRSYGWFLLATCCSWIPRRNIENEKLSPESGWVSVSDRTLVIFNLMYARGSWARPWIYICLDCVLSLNVLYDAYSFKTIIIFCVCVVLSDPLCSCAGELYTFKSFENVPYKNTVRMTQFITRVRNIRK